MLTVVYKRLNTKKKVSHMNIEISAFDQWLGDQRLLVSQPVKQTFSILVLVYAVDETMMRNSKPDSR